MLVKNQKSQNGFNLIELMIVVAIIGVLATVAIPAYSVYTSKAQASEAFQLLNGFKTPVAQQVGEIGLTNGCSLTGSNNAFSSLVSTGRYVQSINLIATTPNCAVVATFKSLLSGVMNEQVATRTVTLNFNSVTGDWSCTTTLPPPLTPSSCNN